MTATTRSSESIAPRATLKLACGLESTKWTLGFTTAPAQRARLRAPSPPVTCARSSKKSFSRKRGSGCRGRLSLYHGDDRYDIRDVENGDLESVETSIVAIGDAECTITFEARLVVEIELTWEERADDGNTETVTDSVSDTLNVSGTATLSFDAKTHALSTVALLKFDEDELEIRATP